MLEPVELKKAYDPMMQLDSRLVAIAACSQLAPELP